VDERCDAWGVRSESVDIYDIIEGIVAVGALALAAFLLAWIAL